MGRSRSMSEIPDIPDEWSLSERPTFADCGTYNIASKVALPTLPGLDELQEYDPRNPKYTINAPSWQVAELEAQHLENQVDALTTMIESRVKVEPGAKVLADYQEVLAGFQLAAEAARQRANSLESKTASPMASPRVKAALSEGSPVSVCRSKLSAATVSTLDPLQAVEEGHMGSHQSDSTDTASATADDWL